MKKGLIILIAMAFVAASCGGVKKRNKRGVEPEPVVAQVVIPEPAKVEVVVPVVPQAPIREVEEKIVPVDNKPVDPSRYFVIIGSFRSQDNARRHQTDIAMDGFRTSELMRNDAGLYRVSVLATNDVTAARAEVMSIRSRFPKYNDVWLLISKR
ncbi:MAG: SPOR domain-containing protein [Bacteroidales bacterium]|nr:SPOR domain-containing protein [Bacteroidales bacterium]